MVCDSKAVRKAQVQANVGAMLIDQQFYNANYQQYMQILEKAGATNVRRGRYANSFAEVYFVFQGVEVRMGRAGTEFSIASNDEANFTESLQTDLSSLIEKEFTPLSKQYATYKLIRSAKQLGKENESKTVDNPLSSYIEVQIKPQQLLRQYGGVST